MLHVEAEVTAKVAQLGTLWRQLRTKLGVKTHVLKTSFWAGYRAGNVPVVEPVWSSTRTAIVLKWVRRSDLGLGCAKLDASWAKVEGRSWSQSWPNLFQICPFLLLSYHASAPSVWADFEMDYSSAFLVQVRILLALICAWQTDMKPVTRLM